MTAEELIERAAACQACGKVHAYRGTGPNQGSWAADDGHEYRPFLEMSTVALLKYLATGTYTDPWALPAEGRVSTRTLVNVLLRRS